MAAIMVKAMDNITYNDYIERMRKEEYPMLKNTIYLDHAGTTIPSKALLDAFHSDMLTTLYGNPHSASPSSNESTRVVERVRFDLLNFFNADPEIFDLVFVANATAGIKLVSECLSNLEQDVDFAYHVDSHTSIVGMREVVQSHTCVENEFEMQQWAHLGSDSVKLFAYPAQSNMNGRRLPLSWCRRLRENDIFTLLDAAAYCSTSALDLNQVAADFTVVSLYKIFGFPDLGALIVRKDAAHLLEHRRYFGGGTVDMVLCKKEEWHARKSGPIHERLEDGSLPVHNIVAVQAALSSHQQLFGSLDRVSRHTMFLARRLHNELQDLKHSNASRAVEVYTDTHEEVETSFRGPIIAFNLKDSSGNWVSTHEVEKLAALKNIHIRTGGMCNPGGVASALQLEPWEIRENFSAGFRCGTENDIVSGKPTGVIRVSLGAMSTMSDVDHFIDFVHEYFVERSPSDSTDVHHNTTGDLNTDILDVEAIIVYPIKSCAGWPIPADTAWDVREEGLAWDREWCILSDATGNALSQKQYPHMALLRPQLDFKSGLLKLEVPGNGQIAVPLSNDRTWLDESSSAPHRVTVCGDAIEAYRYTSGDIAKKLTAFIGTPCTLARFPAAVDGDASHRRCKWASDSETEELNSILLSNESPILTITRSSLNALNEQLKANGKRAAHHSVFRANIILADSPSRAPGTEMPWCEDDWLALQFRDKPGKLGPSLRSLGGCRRCQMVCIDQLTGKRRPEILLTLAKQRRIGGKILFGIHCAMSTKHSRMIKVGDTVTTTRRS